MRLAHILVCHSFIPAKLFASIPIIENDLWYIFLHTDNPSLEEFIRIELERRPGNLFSYRTNRGLANSWNDGIHHAMEAGCDGIMLLNDDLFFYEGGYSIFRDDTLTALRYHDELSMITMNGKETGESTLSGQIVAQNFSCCVLTVHAIKRVGYFDENFTPAYYEDADYSKRTMFSGMASHVDTRILVEHERSSTKHKSTSEQRAALALRIAGNAAYYDLKWGSGSDLYSRPFNDERSDYYIPFSRKTRPYGVGRDRTDIDPIT